MKTLILIEGMPGSGKSTYARFLSVQFERNGYRTVLFHETTADHPIISRSDIQDANDWMKEYIKKWRRFLSNQATEDSVFVMESVLFQNPMINLLNKDVDRDRIKIFITELALILREYETSLIYFGHEDSTNAINEMIESRGGPEFLAQKYEAFKKEKYYINRDHPGPEIHLEFLKEYADMAKELIHKIHLDVLSIDNSRREWKVYEEQILRRYRLAYIPDPFISENEMDECVGIFQNNELNFKIHIEKKERTLYIFGDRKLRCKGKDTFYLDDMSVEITFIKESGIYKKLIIGEKDIFANQNEEGTVFVKIQK